MSNGREDDVAVVVTRGGAVESAHAADVAVVETTADRPRRVAWLGSPERPTFLRSAWKPLQAAVCYECGLDTIGVEPGSEDLAIMSASHGGTDRQRAAVRRLLARAGLDEKALRNGTHEPASAEGRAALAAAGGAPTAIFGNCSGKHAGMLAACVVQGYPTETYLDFDHPLQHRIRARLAEWMAVPEAEVTAGIDGCGLATWVAPLEGAAYGFARLAAGETPSLAAVAESMGRHPELLGDPAGFNARLALAAPNLLAKSGAEAAFALAVPSQRLGIAVKVRDGGYRAVAPLVLGVLRELGLLDAEAERLLADQASPVVRALDGREAGRIEFVASLRR